MYAKVSLIVLLAVASAQAAPSRIVGGHEAKVGEFPYQVSVQYGFNGHICGGSIINEKWIATAGHCIIGSASQYTIVAGLHSLAKDKGQSANVKRIVVHPDYEGGVNPNDIALMELSTELTFGDNVKAIQLPKETDVTEGTSVLSGWGSMSNTQFPDMPDKLQTVDLPILTFNECKTGLENILGSSEPLAKSNVCTSGKMGKSACSGDSGGPLAIRDAGNDVLIGIVSWGIMPCGASNAPSVYTRVSSFVNFINENVN